MKAECTHIDLSAQVTRRSLAPQPSIRSRWPAWVGYAAAAWSLIYSLLGLFWTVGGAGFPFDAAHDPDGKTRSILGHVQPDIMAPAIGAVAGMGMLAALAMARRWTSGLFSVVLRCVGWSMAVTLAIVVPDGRVLIAVARTPLVLIGMPFGWPDDVRFFGEGMYTRPVLHQILAILGGLLWTAATLAYQRWVRNACSHCGRGPEPTGWTTPANAARWGRWAVYAAVGAPVPFMLTHWAWALGIPLGITRETLRAEARDNPDIWLAGAMLATVAACGSLLSLGLIQRWGEIYPRWIPILHQKPVHPRVAIIPAALVSILLVGAGLNAIRARLLGYYPEHSGLNEANWGTAISGLLFPLWGIALGIATLAYFYRRRGRCGACGRG